MKLLATIEQDFKNLLGRAIVSGLCDGLAETADKGIFNIGIGIDYRKRYINACVNYSLYQAIISANNPAITVESLPHSTGHYLKITYGRFYFCPKQVFRSKTEDEESYYQQKMISANPSKQGELFNPHEDTTLPVFVQILFGNDKTGMFARFNIPDAANGGIYDEEVLTLSDTVQVAPEEKASRKKYRAITTEHLVNQ